MNLIKPFILTFFDAILFLEQEKNMISSFVSQLARNKEIRSGEEEPEGIIYVGNHQQFDHFVTGEPDTEPIGHLEPLPKKEYSLSFGDVSVVIRAFDLCFYHGGGMKITIYCVDVSFNHLGLKNERLIFLTGSELRACLRSMASMYRYLEGKIEGKAEGKPGER